MRVSSYDRWLTSEPEDFYSTWFEAMIENTILDIYEQHEDWYQSDECDKMAQELYNQGLNPLDASTKIEKFLKTKTNE